MRCEMIPHGWLQCTRDAGHSGPCANEPARFRVPEPTLVNKQAWPMDIKVEHYARLISTIVAEAANNGVLIRVYQTPDVPLAMGHYITNTEVRPMLHRGKTIDEWEA